MADLVRSILAEYVELDEYTAEYLAQVLESSSGEEDEADLSDLLQGLLETLVDETSVGRCVEVLLKSRDALRNARADKQDEEPPSGVCDGRMGSRGVDPDKENEDSNTSSSSSSQGLENQDQNEFGRSQPSVSALSAVFPDLDCRLLHRVLVSNDGDLDAAVNDLLSRDESDLASMMDKLRLADEERRRRETLSSGGDALDATTKAAILRQGMLQAVSSGRGKQSRKQLRKTNEFLNAQVSGRKDAPQVRFRDGVVASTKGQKFIVENLKEEWDGGSSGKVYTKGKRGKGFVG